MIYNTFTLALMQSPGDVIPKAPSPSDYSAFGFAGVIFGSFVFVMCVMIFLSWKYFTSKDAQWAAQQDRRDAALATTLKDLSSSHEKAVERVAQASERQAEGNFSSTRDMAQAVKDLTRSVDQSHKVFSEETLYQILRRVMREVKGPDA